MIQFSRQTKLPPDITTGVKLFKPTSQPSQPSHSDIDLKDIGATLYGEANSDVDEMRAIASIVLNRSKELGKTPSEIVKAKNQFYGYYNKQADKYRAGDLDFMGQEKAKLVQQVLDEIKSGQLKDSTGGAFFFDHHGGKFSYDNTKPLVAGKKKIVSGKIVNQLAPVQAEQSEVVGGFMEDITKELAKVPVRTAMSIADTPRVFVGADPLQEITLPWIGSVASSQRKAADAIQGNDTSLGKAAKLLNIASESILDIAAIGSLAAYGTKIAGNNAAKKELTKAVPTIKRHIITGKQVLETLSPEQIAAKGGEQALVQNIRTNIADGLAHEGMKRAAEAVRLVDASTVKDFSVALSKLVKNAGYKLPSKTPAAIVVGLNGGSMPNLSELLSRDDKELQKLRDETVAEFPFTPEASKAAVQVLFGTEQSGEGVFSRSNNDLRTKAEKYLSPGLAKTFNELLSTSKPKIKINLKAGTPESRKGSMAHEMMHKLFEDSFGAQTNEQNRKYFVQQFNDRWQKSRNANMETVDGYLKSPFYVSVIENSTDPDYMLATERFAMLAQYLMHNPREALGFEPKKGEEIGLSAIPSELKPFYKGIIKGI